MIPRSKKSDQLTPSLDIAQATVAADRIIEMRKQDHSDGRLVSLDLGNIGDNDKGIKIQFQNVWFRYPTRDVPILNGLNLTVCLPFFSELAFTLRANSK